MPGAVAAGAQRMSWVRASNAMVGFGGEPARAPLEQTRISVLSLNIQVEAPGWRRQGIIDLIRNSGADIIGLQECGAETANDIARALGMHVVQTGPDTPVLSRFPIEPPAAGQRGVNVVLPSGQRVRFMNLHLAHAPYQPFQLLRIPYENGRFITTEAEAISEAWRTRGADVQSAIDELATERGPAIIVGDMNQPSHLDWTAAAAEAGYHPLRVRWPESAAIESAGFIDAYRKLFPDEVTHPGRTWNPHTRRDDPTDHHDRLDFVHYRGGMTPTRARIIGEDAANADIVVTPYPTDHRGVLIDFTLPLAAGARAALGR